MRSIFISKHTLNLYLYLYQKSFFMRKKYILFIFLLQFFIGFSQNTQSDDVVYTDLVWSDQFDIDGAVDNTKWHHQTFGPNNGQWYNGEQQHYTNSLTNSYVSNGFLNIVAKKEVITQGAVTLNYSSARLNSKFAFTYGRVDVKAKLPFGNGTWPAIWTLGKNINEQGGFWDSQYGTVNWPACGEIDIMEHGIHGLNEVSAAIHTPSSSGGTVNTSTQVLNDVANTFHVYSMIWSPNQITFLIDNVGYYTYKPSVLNNSTWPFYLDQYLLLNVAMGGIAGAIDSNFTESSMVIDYVRVYQNTTASTEDLFSSKFSIFPNPVENLLKVKTDENIDRIEIYSLIGQLVLKKEKSNEVDVSSLKSGVYLMTIFSQGKKVIKKMIKS